MAPDGRFVYPILVVAITWLWWDPNPPIEEIGFCGAFLAALIRGLAPLDLLPYYLFCLPCVIIASKRLL